MIYLSVLVDLVFKLVLHRDGSKVPHTRIIAAILGSTATTAQWMVFNPGLTLPAEFPHATIRLTPGAPTPAWRNLGECVSFESHFWVVHDARDAFGDASCALRRFRCARFGQASAHSFVVR